MANPIVGIFRVKELRERIIFTVLMLVVFRLGAYIPIPGVNVQVLTTFFKEAQGSTQGGSNAIVDYLNFFAGGAFSNFSVFMLGIMPYISMSIIMQLLLIVFPKLKKLSQEEGGKKKIQMYQRFGTVAVCIVQSFAVTQYAQTISREVGGWSNLVSLPFVQFAIIAIMTVTTGTMFLMWIGEQITKRGIGNGISLLIFAGIVARLPISLWELRSWVEADNARLIYIFIVLIIFVAVVGIVVLEQQGQRKIQVNYAKRVVGRRMYGAQNTYIPFKINPSGVIPVIFASSILTFPLQIAQTIGGNVSWLASLSRILTPQGALYNILYVLLIIFFAYFYTQVSLNPIEIAKNIRENGGSIPGIRSERIEEYLTKILNRIVLPGSIYLAFIAVIPTFIQWAFGFPSSISYLLGGTSLLILVGVDLDTMSQIEGLLKMHHHDGLTRKGRLRGRNL